MSGSSPSHPCESGFVRVTALWFRPVFLVPVLFSLALLLVSCASHAPLSGLENTHPGLDRIRESWLADPAPPDSSAPPVTVVYPRGDAPDTVLAPGDSVVLEGSLPPDSLFLLGSVRDPAGTLTVNNVLVPIHPDGGWLAWVPRGPIQRLSPARELGPGHLAVVTIRYREPSHEQEVVRRILFLDKPDSPPGLTEPFTADTTRLVVSEPNAKIRCGWPGTYDLFPPEGTMLRAVQRISGARVLWKVPLGNGVVGWIEDEYVTPLPDDEPLPLDVIYSVVGKVVPGEFGRASTVIDVPLRMQKPFRVEQVADDRIELTIYGAVAWTDLIIQPYGSRAVDELRWSQVDSTTWKLTAFIDPLWFNGWDVEFAPDNDLVWTIHDAPELDSNVLEGVRIVVDPGHGGADYSAIGPTGLPEKTVNLRLAEAVTREFEDAGAVVIPTRTEDQDLGLYERVRFIREQRPDLALSLHHNALAQGIRPFEHHGASVHYNHRHAHKLAEAIYGEIARSDWPVHGLRYQDLALARVHVCPSVLIEAGYMMHPGEEAIFRTEAYHDDMARWIREGVEAYLAGVRERRLNE